MTISTQAVSHSLTVIIPTRRRRDSLALLLEHLAAQTDTDFTICVSVDDDDVEGYRRRFGSQASGIDLEFTTPSVRGRSGARNAGGRVALSDILLFLDDDTRPPRDCIAEHKKLHRGGPEEIVAGLAFEELTRNMGDFQLFKALLSRRWVKSLLAAEIHEDSSSQFPPFFSAAHFSIGRRLFLGLGGFDETLSDCEDFEFADRARRAGTTIRLEAQLVVWHDDFSSCAGFINRQRQYIAAKSTLLQKFPERFKELRGFLRPRPSVFKRAALYPLANSKWVQIADDGRLLRFVPQSIRHKFYEFLTTALSFYYPDVPLSD